MKIFLMVFIVIGMISGFTNLAIAYPPSVTVDSDANGCKNFDDCDALANASVLIQSFETGIYNFTVDPAGGAWFSNNSPDTPDNFTLGAWFWSLYIYNPQSDTLYGDPGPTLGSNNDFLTEQNALNQSNNSVTINVGSTGDLWFYIKDRSPRDNIGTVTADIVLVPEPVSTTLFILGGAVFAGRMYLRKRNRV